MNPWKMKPYQRYGQEVMGVEISVKDFAKHSPGIRELDPQIRRDANRSAALLADVFVDLGEQLRVERDLVTGQRLDPRKRRKVGVALRQGHVDPYELRAYQSRRVLPDMPKIAIMAAAQWRMVHGNYAYISRVAQLALTLTWACEAAGLDYYAGMSLGWAKPSRSTRAPYKDALLVYRLGEMGEFVNLPAYNVFMDKWDFIRGAYAKAYDETGAKPFRDLCAQMRGRFKVTYHTSYPSASGGYAVHWARQEKAADIVIAVGQLDDGDNADVQLDAGFDVKDAVREVARQVRLLAR